MIVVVQFDGFSDRNLMDVISTASASVPQAGIIVVKFERLQETRGRNAFGYSIAYFVRQGKTGIPAEGFSPSL